MFKALVGNSGKLFILACFILLLAILLCGCNEVIIPPTGQSAMLLQDVNRVKVAVLVDKVNRKYKIGYAKLRAGAMIAYLDEEEFIDWYIEGTENGD